MTLEQVMAFLHAKGIVLESAQGPVPSLANFIAGEPIRGSWWSHPQSREIFHLSRAVRNSEQVLVSRLVAGKITFIHQRLWPGLVRLSSQFPFHSLAKLHEEHTDSGQHAITEIPFPSWVPSEILTKAGQLTESEAWAMLRSCAPDAFGVKGDGLIRRRVKYTKI